MAVVEVSTLNPETTRRAEISRRMSLVRTRGTGAEVHLRRQLAALGIRYRLNSRLPGKPDLVIPALRLAIFVDGDFWHGTQWFRRGFTSLEAQFTGRQSGDYWVAKIRRNMLRDCQVTSSLLSNRWSVLRFWEHEIFEHPERCMRAIMRHAMEDFHEYRSSIAAPQKTVAEFFAGIGLMRMGLERTGWRVTLANDIDPLKQEMYRSHFGGVDDEFVLGDIHAIAPSTVPDVTLATASFPCTDLSLAGAREGLSGKQSSAFWGFVNILDGMGYRRPPLVLIENVTGFLTSNKGEDFTRALRALNKIGYAVDTFVIDAAHFVPQSRQRLFVVGIKRDSNSCEAPSGTGAVFESAARPRALAEFIFNHPEIDWSLRTLPAFPKRETRLDGVLEKLPESAKEWWSVERVDYLLAQMSVKHRAIADGMIAKRRWSHGTVFRRVRNGKSMAELRTDGIAGCLRTPKGGSGRQILFSAGYGKVRVRLLTARECARLMGADDFRIEAPLNQALFGFGDAVCVSAIEWIANNYLDPVVAQMIRGEALFPKIARVA